MLAGCNILNCVDRLLGRLFFVQAQIVQSRLVGAHGRHTLEGGKIFDRHSVLKELVNLLKRSTLHFGQEEVQEDCTSLEGKGRAMGG